MWLERLGQSRSHQPDIEHGGIVLEQQINADNTWRYFLVQSSNTRKTSSGYQGREFLILRSSAVDGIDRPEYVYRVLRDAHPVQAEDQIQQPSQSLFPRLPEIRTVDWQTSVTTISRYGLPESSFDYLGLRGLHTRIRRDFSNASASTDEPITRNSSAASLVFEGDLRLNRSHRRIEDSDTEDEASAPVFSDLLAASGLPSRWVDAPLDVRQFIDDISGGEKHVIATGVMSLSQHKQVVDIHAVKCQTLYATVGRNATAVGIKVNALKTQLLCLSTAINYEVRSYI